MVLKVIELKIYRKWFLLWIGLIIVMTGCGSVPSSTSKTSAVTEGKTYKLGESAELFDLKVTVNDVQKPKEFDQQILKEGMVFVLLNVTVENTGKEKMHYDSYNFNLKSSNGKTRDLSLTTLNNTTELHAGDLAPGEKVTGILPYEHPANDPDMQLQFMPNMMSQKLIIFQLK
jgi:hypothetical protein